MVGARSFTDNSYDGHVLVAQLEQTSNLMKGLGRRPTRLIVDLGFRGLDADNPVIDIIRRGKFKALSAEQKRRLKR